jgi:hypothetical protein
VILRTKYTGARQNNFNNHLRLGGASVAFEAADVYALPTPPEVSPEDAASDRARHRPGCLLGHDRNVLIGHDASQIKTVVKNGSSYM